MRVGIIGTGRHGTRYARHVIKDVDGLTLTAISRRSSEGEAQASEWGVRLFKDWQDLVGSPLVDAVISATTPNLNLDIAMACAEAGKPMLMEKPLAVNTKEAEQIVAVSRDAGVPVTIGQTLRFNPVVLSLKKELFRVGDLFLFSANHRLEEVHHSWLDDPEVAGGGVILHTAVHMFDALRFITGREVTRVKAKKYCRRKSRLEDLFIALVELNDGIVGTVDASKVGPARTGLYEFVGSSGQLQGDQIHGRIEFIRGSSVEELSPENPSVPTIVPLLNCWRDFLRGERPNPIPVEEGLASVRICDACVQSADEDRWVEVITPSSGACT